MMGQTKYPDAEAAILRAVVAHQDRLGYTPTYRVIAARTGLPVHVVASAVQRMVRAGMIRRPWPDSARCWEVLVSMEAVAQMESKKSTRSAVVDAKLTASAATAPQLFTEELK